MQNAIRSIVNEVPKGYIFDSHFVINELIKRFSDEYLSFVSNYATKNPKITLIIHGQIGKEINKLDGTVLRKIGDAWSENIHKTPSKCTCWERL